MLRSGLLIALTSVALGGAITGSGVAGAQAEARIAGGTAAAVGEPLTPSSPDQLDVSAYLNKRGAVFYGAWWCPACVAQKNLFGKEAGAQLPYVECDKTDEGRQRCSAAKVRAFPTWDLDGKRLEGVQSLEELKVWSGYPGGGASLGSSTAN
jgi:glutaredoxin